MPNLMDFLTPEQIEQLKAMRESIPETPKTAPASVMPQVDDVFGKVRSEDMVNRITNPGKSAVESAEVLAPKELPVPTSDPYNARQLRGATRATNAATGEAGKGVIELSEGDGWKRLPALLEKAGLPATTKAAGLPATIAHAGETGLAQYAEAGTGDVLSDALGYFGKGAAKIGGPLLKVASKVAAPVAYMDALHGELADPSQLPVQTPEHAFPSSPNTNMLANGPDLIKAPNGMADSLMARSGDGMAKPVPAPVNKLASVPATGTRAPASAPVETGPRKPSPLDAILAKLNGNDDDMNAARANRNQLQFLSMLGQGTNQILGGATRTTPDNGVLKQMMALAPQQVEDLQTDQKMAGEKLKNQETATKLYTDREKADPNSDISRVGRDVLREAAARAGMKINVTDNMSLSQQEKLLPGIEGMANRKLASDTNNIYQQQRLDLQKAEIDRKTKENFSRAQERGSKMLEADPIFKEMNKQGLALDQVDGLLDMVKSGNTVAFNALGSKMARAMGEVGVLTENDVKRYVMSGALSQKAADVLSTWGKGKPSKATLEEISQIGTVLKQQFDSKMQPIYDKYANRLSEQFEVPIEKAYKALDVSMPKNAGKTGKFYDSQNPKATSATPSPSAPPASNEVERRTADGKVAIFDATTKKFLRYK
jgi:hypothetical protein